MFVDIEQRLCHRQIDVLAFASSFAGKQRRQNRARAFDRRVDIGVAKRVVGVVATTSVTLALC